MTRRQEPWSKHTNSAHKLAPGSPFGSTHGLPLRQSCPICSQPMLPRETEVMPQMRGQRRCIDRVACASARGGRA